MTKRKVRPWRADWGWLLVVFLIIFLGMRWIPGVDGGKNDSWSSGPGGKRIIYTLAATLLGDARRNEIPLDRWRGDVETLCVLGPARYPGAAEWGRLVDWVRGGGTLIFAAKHHDPAVALARFGLEVRPRDSGEEWPDDDLEEERRSNEFGGRLAEDREPGEIEWRSRGRIDSDGSAVEILLEERDVAQVVAGKLGSGMLVVASSDHAFSNSYLARSGSASLAFRILEWGHRSGGRLAFDESLNISGTPKVFGLLFSPGLRRVTLQCILLGVLFGWMGSRRFGPVVSGRESWRRSILEHARALGNLHFKAGTGSHALRSYLDYFRHELRRWYSGRSPESLSVLAPKAGRDEAEVRDLLAQAAGRSQEARLSSSQAAGTIRRLAKLKQDLEG